MRMVQKLDAGPVILQLGTSVNEDETYGELALRLSELGAAALIEALALIEAGEAREVPQDDALATYAPKIDRSLTRVDWSRDSAIVSRTIRAYDPRPGAFTTLKGSDVKLFGSRPVASPAPAVPGTVVAAGREAGADGGVVVACGAGAVRILQIQPAGRKRMSGEEWARGRGIGAGDRFE
jgi:methionyl-tRNA formyltransferase